MNHTRKSTPPPSRKITSMAILAATTGSDKS
jgi:hypothetical protein